MKKIVTILGMTLAMNAFAQIPTNGLVGYWPFTGNANDNSGNANNGTVNGTTLITDRFGNANSAYDFSGNNDYIEVSTTSGIFNNQSYTYSFWTKNNSLNNAEAFISRLTPNGSLYDNFCFFASNGLANLNYWSTNGNMLSSANDGNGPNMLGNVWQHIVITVASDSIRSYLNGTMMKKEIFVAGINFNNNYPIRFGKSNHAFWTDFSGTLDDIAIYNRQLTETEINNLYCAGVSVSSTIAPTGSTTFCQGGNVILTANSSTSYLWNNNATTQSITVTNAGNYSVTTTNSIGCTATSTTTAVTVNPLPTVGSIVSPSATVCAGTNITLNGTGALTYVWSGGITNGTAFMPTSTTYTVTGTDANTCSNTATKTITVNPLPTVSINTVPNFININNAPIALTGVPTGGTFTGNGVSNNNFSPTIAGLGTSQITYNYTNNNNCSNSTITSTIVYDTTGMLCTTYDTTYISVTDTLFINAVLTGINPPNNINTVKVFPNPANDHVTVDYGNYSSMIGYTLKITNSLGQTVFTTFITQQSNYIDLSAWTGNGIYFVNIVDTQNNTIDIKKIVLQ